MRFAAIGGFEPIKTNAAACTKARWSDQSRLKSNGTAIKKTIGPRVIILDPQASAHILGFFEHS